MDTLTAHRTSNKRDKRPAAKFWNII
jgi:hypothetical protein